MIVVLVTMVLVAPPEPTVSHAAKAHTENIVVFEQHLLGNLAGYSTLSKDIGNRLAFMAEVRTTVENLDSFRESSITGALENTLPGFRWITALWDKLSGLVNRVENIQKQLRLLNTKSNDLAFAAQRYVAAPDDPHFEAFIRSYEDSRPVFNNAKEAFADLDKFMNVAAKTLGHARAVLSRAAKLPLVGEYATDLVNRVDGVSAKVIAAQQVLKLVPEAIERDEKHVAQLKSKMDRAKAQDSYAEAETEMRKGRPGTALKLFREIRDRWPNTEWAHRADRRIVELLAYIDSLAGKIAALEQEVEKLDTALSLVPQTEIKLKTKTVRKVDVRHKIPVWIIVLCGGLGAGALVSTGILFRRKHQKVTPPETNDDEALETPDYLDSA